MPTATAALLAWWRPRRPSRTSPRPSNWSCKPRAVHAQDRRLPSPRPAERGCVRLGRRRAASPSPLAPDGSVATVDDGRLLTADGGQTGAEVLHVIESHVGHRRHAAVPGIGRIEAAAETDLHHGDVDGRSERRPGKAAAVRTSNWVGGPRRRATPSLADRALRSTSAKSSGVSSRPSDDDPARDSRPGAAWASGPPAGRPRRDSTEPTMA